MNGYCLFLAGLSINIYPYEALKIFSKNSNADSSSSTTAWETFLQFRLYSSIVS